VRGKAGAERAEGSFVRHGGKIADAMNLKTKKTRAFFQDAIDVNKAGLVELVAPRRVAPQWWDEWISSAAGFRGVRRLTLRPAPGRSQRDQHYPELF
jgi:hypothetical protein